MIFDGMKISDLCELIQHDLTCVLDGQDNDLVDKACQIVVDRVKQYKETRNAEVPEFRQLNPHDQMTVVLMSLEGDTNNLADGIGEVPAVAPRLLSCINSLRVLQQYMRGREWQVPKPDGVCLMEPTGRLNPSTFMYWEADELSEAENRMWYRLEQRYKTTRDKLQAKGWKVVPVTIGWTSKPEENPIQPKAENT